LTVMQFFMKELQNEFWYFELPVRVFWCI